MEDYDKIKKSLAVAFMHDLDANRPEGKMCLSNGECADIEKAFNKQDWPKLARYLDKYTESEDEWIPKELIEYLKQKGDYRSCWIVWLENHKESLHVPETCEENAVSLTGEDEGIVNWLYDLLKGLREKAPENCPDNSIADKALAWLEKQKEPKHAPDELQKSFEAGQTSIVDNPERYGLCKKAEWSEEDEKILHGIEQCVYENVANIGTADKVKYIDWLESLRPSWKPSEGQGDALVFAIKAFRDRTPIRDNLLSLYNDLKKL